MNNATTILEAFELSAGAIMFVQQSSERAERDSGFTQELANAFDIGLATIPEDKQLAVVQYAVVELLNDTAKTVAEVLPTAIEKAHALAVKMGIDTPSPEGSTTRAPKAERASNNEKKVQARALYDANVAAMKTSELIALIAKELDITAANARYYVTRVFASKAA